jgi:predicted ATPase
MIERIYIQNFRCLESFTLKLGSEPSALIIGKNGTGKTTTRKAIELFQAICRGSNRVGTLISQDDFAFGRTDRPMRFEIDVLREGGRYEYAVSFDWPPHFREARILDERLNVNGRPVFARVQNQVELAGGATFGLDWHVFAISVVNEKPPGRSIEDLKAFLASLVLIAPVPTNMKGYSRQTTAELNEDASNYASCLRGLLEKKPAAYSEFVKFIQSVIPDFSAFEHEDRGKDGKQLRVTFKRPDAEENLTVEFDALSDGEKCYFLSAYIVASTAAGFPVVCVWDEPDNHLSLSDVGQFIISLRKMAHRGGQFIATSHHPEVVRKFSDETTFVLTRKSHLDPTLPKPLTEFHYDGNLIDALIRDEIIG